jgi:hypothetical protein
MWKMVALVAAGLPFAANALECTVSTAYVCDGHKCTPAPTTIRINVDTDKRAIFRCDAKGCDPIPVETSSSGVMVNYVAATNGYIFRHNTADDSFVEISTSMTIAFVKHGQCRR